MSNWLASQLSIISNLIKADKGTNPITNDVTGPAKMDQVDT